MGSLERGLDLLLEPVVGGNVRLVGRVGRTSAARDWPDSTTEPVDGHGAGVTFVREAVVLARVGVVAQDDDFEGVEDEAVLGVVTGDGFQAIDTSVGGAGGTTVLDGQEGLGVVEVVVVGIAEVLFGDPALDLEEQVVGDVEVASVVRLSEHVLLPVASVLVSSCRQRGVSDKEQKEERETDAPT